MHLFTIALLSLVSLLIYDISKIINGNGVVAILSGLFIPVSQIFFYDYYTISGLDNILILLVALSTVLLLLKYLNSKRIVYVYIAVLLSFLAIFIKETYIIIPFMVFIFTVFCKTIKKTTKLRVLALTALPTLIYVPIKLSFYRFVKGSPYTPNVTLSTAVNNLHWLGSWLLGVNNSVYMFMPNPLPQYYSWLIFGNFIILVLLMFFLYKNSYRLALGIVLWLFMSIAPIIFFPRPLPYYLELSLIGIIIGFSFIKNSRTALLLVWTYLLLTVIQGNIIRDQWQRFSFIASANSVVTSLNNSIAPHLNSNVNGLCLNANNSGDSWAIQAGNSAKYFFPQLINIHTVSNPYAQCKYKNTIVVESTLDKYKFVKTIP